MAQSILKTKLFKQSTAFFGTSWGVKILNIAEKIYYPLMRGIYFQRNRRNLYIHARIKSQR